MNSRNNQFLSCIGLILTSFIWGFAFVVVKDGLDYIGPYWMVAIRFSIAAIFLSLIYMKRLFKINRSMLIHGMMLGFYLFAAYIVQTIGCKYTTAGKNAFLTTIYVILVPILSWPLLKKKPTAFVLLAAVMSLSGIGLLTLSGENSQWYCINKGDLLTLLCGVFFTFHIVLGAMFVKDEDPILLSILQFAVCGILGFAISPFLDEKISIAVISERKVIISLLYLGIFSSMICFVLQNVCLKFVKPALASLFLSLESVFGVLFGYLMLDETLTGKSCLGCILIFASIMISEVLPELKKHHK